MFHQLLISVHFVCPSLTSHLRIRGEEGGGRERAFVMTISKEEVTTQQMPYQDGGRKWRVPFSAVCTPAGVYHRCPADQPPHNTAAVSTPSAVPHAPPPTE